MSVFKKVLEGEIESSKKAELNELRNLVKVSNNNYDKVVFIINGDGESGKDYLINKLPYFGINASNESLINPIKRIMLSSSVWDGRKDDKGRKLLHEVKDAVDKYNNFTIQYMIKIFNIFMESQSKILFIHAGGINDIDILQYVIKPICPVVKIYIKSTGKTCYDDPRYGNNRLDEQILDKYYDIIFLNDRLNIKDNYKNEASFAEIVWNKYKHLTQIDHKLLDTDNNKLILHIGSLDPSLSKKSEYKSTFTPSVKDYFNRNIQNRSIRKVILSNELLMYNILEEIISLDLSNLSLQKNKTISLVLDNDINLITKYIKCSNDFNNINCIIYYHIDMSIDCKDRVKIILEKVNKYNAILIPVFCNK